jgi:hypothetical protein
MNEIGALDPEVNVYRGVGKMSVVRHTGRISFMKSFLTTNRFLQVPRPDLDKSLKKQEKELSDDLDVLNKKVSCPRPLTNRKPDKGMSLQGKYLEKEFNDAQGQLRDIVRLLSRPSHTLAYWMMRLMPLIISVSVSSFRAPPDDRWYSAQHGIPLSVKKATATHKTAAVGSCCENWWRSLRPY